MIKFFVLGLCFFTIVLLISAFKIILLKKQILYRFVNKDKKVTSFDYLMDFDGNLLFKKLDLNTLSVEEKNSSVLISKLKKIVFLKKILILFSILFFVFLVLMKISKIV
jgi:hypothetical protein